MAKKNVCIPKKVWCGKEKVTKTERLRKGCYAHNHEVCPHGKFQQIVSEDKDNIKYMRCYYCFCLFAEPEEEKR